MTPKVKSKKAKVEAPEKIISLSFDKVKGRILFTTAVPIGLLIQERTYEGINVWDGVSGFTFTFREI